MRGMISIEHCVNTETNSLNRYLERCQERMLIAVRKEEVLKVDQLAQNRKNIQILENMFFRMVW